jgi:alpha-glucosidase
MSRTGLPIMRPLFLEFPAPAADGGPIDLANGNVFMLGPDLLVAQSPYPDEVDNYSVALPPVGWYDYWTGALAEGSAGRKAIDNTPVAQPEIQIHRSLDTLPVFVRAGAIVPEQPLIQSTDEKPDGPLTLRVYPPAQPGKECSGSLYLDDGETYAFQKGDFLRVAFTCRATANRMTVTVDPHQGAFAPWWKLLSIEVYGASRPAADASSTLGGGQPKPAKPGFDPEHHRIVAILPDDGKGLELQVVY